MFRFPLLLTGCWLASVFASGAEPPWVGQPFEAAAKEMAESAASVVAQGDASHELLLKQVDYRFDESGRQKRVERRVWRINHAAAIEQLGMVEVVWAPWHERRPTIEARVISPSGEEHRFDSSLVAEISSKSNTGQVISDRKVLRGPLPGLSVGSVVEQVITSEEQQPFFAAGRVEALMLAEFQTIHRLRITVTAPAILPLKCAVRGGDEQPKRDDQDNTTTYRIDFSRVEPIKEIEPLQPPDYPRFPVFWISTARSWNEVGKSYAAQVEKQIDLSAVEPLVRQTLRGGESRTDAIRRLVLRLQEQVRYTSVAFGESAIVPYTPQQTLARRFGDCKDQATLLVAMLRVAGFPAHLALVRTAGLEDVPQDFPGIGHFDHAIVYVPGEPPLWIDPTYSSGDALEVPLAVHGRLSLVANDTTKELVRIPRAASSQNFSRITRDLKLQRSGRGTYVEVSESGGSLAAERRNDFLLQTSNQLRSAFEQFSENNLHTKTITRLDYPNVADRSKPMRVEFEAANALLAGATGVQATLEIDPSIILRRMPELLISMPPKKGFTAAKDIKRRHPLLLIEPHVCELECRLQPPPGMMLQTIPAPMNKRWGPAELKCECTQQSEGDTVLKFRFDTGDGRFTAEEIDALRGELSRLAADGHAGQWRIPLMYELKAWRLARDRKWKESFAEFRRLLEKQPDDGVLRGVYAEMLVNAGMGLEGRREARRATETAGEATSPFLSLGFSLCHDEIGRYLRRGMDLAGAEQAYQQVTDRNTSALVSLALLHEYNSAGDRYAERERIKQAIPLYQQALTASDHNHDTRVNLCRALLALEDFAALQTEAPKLAAEEARHSALLAGVAATTDTQAAIRLLDSWNLSDEQRRAAVLGAVIELDRIRKYEPALSLLQAVGVSPVDRPLQQILAMLKIVRRWEDVMAAPGTPVRLVQDLLTGMVTSGPEEALLRKYADGACIIEPAIMQLDVNFQLLRHQARTQSALPQRRHDGLTVLRYEAEGGDELGYRVKITSPQPNDRPNYFYVVRRDNGYRIAFSGFDSAELGHLALAHLDAGRLEAASTWLGWAADAQRDQINIFNPFSASPFTWLWRSVSKDDAQKLRIMAATLAVSSLDPAAAAAELEKARSEEQIDPIALQIDRALLRGLATAGRWDEAMAVVDRLSERYPNSPSPQWLRFQALNQQGKIDETRPLIDSLYEKNPNDLSVLNAAIDIRQRTEDYLGANELLQKGVDRNAALFTNDRTWNLLFIDPLPRESLMQAAEALRQLNPTDHRRLHTLAAVQAELGDAAAALVTLRQAVDATPLDQLQDSDWYVIGQIAECYGLVTAAREAYGRVRGPAGATSFTLAQRRLQKL